MLAVFALVCLMSVSGCGMSSKEYSMRLPNVEKTKPQKDKKKAALLNVELGLGYLAQGEITRAKSKLVHALVLAPQLPETHSAMAFFYEAVSETQRAKEAYEKAIRLGRRSGKFYNNYAAFLCRKEQYEQADAYFLKAINDNAYSRTAEVYESAGICSIQGRRFEKAKHYFETALLRDPRRTRSILELANLNYKINNLNAAKMLLEEYKKSGEYNARFLWIEMQIAQSLNDQDTVASNRLKLKNLYSHSKEYQHSLAIGEPL